MSDLTSAYETLADPARRRKYDRRRGLTARQARFYFKNPERERHPPFTAFALRAAARKAQLYRNAVFGLMVVVVILSAFNVYQNAPKIRELFGGHRSASNPLEVTAPRNGASSPRAADADAAPTDAAPVSTTANVRVLPIAPVTTRPITSGTIEAPAAVDAPATESAQQTSSAVALPSPAKRPAQQTPSAVALPAPTQAPRSRSALPAPPNGVSRYRSRPPRRRDPASPRRPLHRRPSTPRARM
jgi:hypothetical protein